MAFIVQFADTNENRGKRLRKLKMLTKWKQPICHV